MFAEGLPAFTAVTVRWDCSSSACSGPVLASGTTDGAGRATFVDVRPPAAGAGPHTIGVIAGSAFGKANFTLT